MSRLTELNSPSETRSGRVRRWFSSPSTDLILWYEGGRICGFEFCYDKASSEHALVWKAGGPVRHLEVDDGEQSLGMNYKESPIYVPDGSVDMDHVQRELCQLRADLPSEIYQFVEEKISGYAEGGGET